MKKNNLTTKDKRLTKTLNFTGWVTLSLAVIIPTVGISYTYQFCEKTLVGGCAMGTAYPGIITSIIIGFVLALTGLIILLVSSRNR